MSGSEESSELSEKESRVPETIRDLVDSAKIEVEETKESDSEKEEEISK